MSNRADGTKIPFTFPFPDFKYRISESERMDDAAVDTEKLYRTLDHFRIINLVFSRSRFLLRTILLPHMARQHRTVSLLDIGAGGCDISLWLARECRRLNIPVMLTCLDNNPFAVLYATEKTRNHQNITVVRGDAFDRNGPLQQEYDYIFANHFLHHIDNADIPVLLRIIHGKARCGFLINDLVRSSFAYAVFRIAGLLFFAGSLTYRDGLTSIRRGFTFSELHGIVDGMNLSHEIRVGTRIPSRVFMYCLKKGNNKSSV